MELEKVGTAIHFHPNLPSTRIYCQIYVPVDDDKHFFYRNTKNSFTNGQRDSREGFSY